MFGYSLSGLGQDGTFGTVGIGSDPIPDTSGDTAGGMPNDPSSGSGGWSAILQGVVQQAANVGLNVANVIGTRPPQGTYVQTGPNGTMYYSMPQGAYAGASFLPPGMFNMGSGSLLTFALLAVGGIILVKAIGGSR